MRARGTTHLALLRRAILVVASITLYGSASGQQLVKVMSGAQMRMLHAAMDTNGDDLVSKEEASTLVRTLRTAVMQQQTIGIVQTMDADQDGFLSLAELHEDLRHFRIEEERKATFVDRFPSFDDDGDGRLSSSEVLPLFNFMFAFQKLDTNRDNVLSASEFRAIAAPKLEGAPPAEIAKSKAEAKAIFTGLDADSDGRVDAKEHYVYDSGVYAGLVALSKLFELADTTGDGMVSADELVELRSHPQFGGSAAYHHSQDWIQRIEQVVGSKQPASANSEVVGAKQPAKPKAKRAKSEL